MTRRFRSRIYSEGKTAHGQMVEFCCETREDIAKVQAALQLVDRVESAETHRTNVAHGGYGAYSRFDIRQHNYAGSDNEAMVQGYLEVIEVVGAPVNHCGNIIHDYRTDRGSVFHEFKTIKDAKAAWKKHFRTIWGDDPDDALKAKGFLRTVRCGELEPWFYAVGDQEIIGDFVFPDFVGNDPVFRPLRRFWVKSEGEYCIKTCLGVRWVNDHGGYDFLANREKERHFRIVFFSDGSYWQDFGDSASNQPIPVNQSVNSIIDQFSALLSGQKTDFTLKIPDGEKFATFIGRLMLPRNPTTVESGRYEVKILFEDGSEISEEIDFDPYGNEPTMIDYLRRLHEEGQNRVIKSVVYAHKVGAWNGISREPPKQDEGEEIRESIRFQQRERDAKRYQESGPDDDPEDE